MSLGQTIYSIKALFFNRNVIVSVLLLFNWRYRTVQYTTLTSDRSEGFSLESDVKLMISFFFSVV